MIVRIAVLVLSTLIIPASVSHSVFDWPGRGVLPSSERTHPHTFQINRAWLKLPGKWKLGDASSVAVDARDHVWVLHRPRTLPTDQIASTAPPVLEFDAADNFIQGWGGPGNGYQWPEREHGLYVDYRNHGLVDRSQLIARDSKLPGLKPVADDQLVKFTTTGKFVMQVGRSNASGGNSDTRNLHRTRRRICVSEDERGVRGRWVRQPPRDCFRCRDRRIQTGMGRLWQQTDR